MKRWPLHKAYFWDTAPFFRLLLPLVAGIALYPLWKGSLMVALFTALFAYLLFLTTSIFKTQNAIRRTATFVSLHIFFIFQAFSLCFLNDVRNDKQWFGATVNTADFYKVRISETPAEKESTYKLQVDVLESILPDRSQNAEGKAFLYIYKGKKTSVFNKGDTLIVSNKWQLIKNAGNPFEFDYARYCARNNIYYQQFIGAKDIKDRRPGNVSDKSYTESAHEWCMATLEHYVSDKQTLGLIQSMLIGDEVNLDNDTRQAFTETGIVHVIAISGGNIAILFVLVLAMLSWLRHKKYLWLKYALSLPLVWFYVLMAGASPSAVRAAVMFTILAIGFVIQRRKDNNNLNQLFATAFILLVAQPMWLYAIGFQLSFIAVLSLILFYKRIYRIWIPSNRILRSLWGTVAASIAAEILVAPIVIYYFHTFPLMFIISNVVAYVLMSCVLILGMGIIALSSISILASAIATITTWFVSIFFSIISFLQTLEPKSFHTLRLDIISMILLYLLIVSAAIYLIYKKRYGMVSAVVALIALFISLGIQWSRDKAQRRLVIYNVGKLHHIELITGNSFTVLASNASIPTMTSYAVTPSHIGWQAFDRNNGALPSVLTIGGKTVTILRDTADLRSKAGSADKVIIAYKAKVKDLRLIDSLFQPETIILGSSMSGRQLSNWKAICSEKGMELHSMQDGAYILEDQPH